jgi:hypothetical protein
LRNCITLQAFEKLDFKPTPPLQVSLLLLLLLLSLRGKNALSTHDSSAAAALHRRC